MGKKITKDQFVTTCLKKRDPFEAIQALIEGPFFPKPWNDAEFERLPEIIKLVNRLNSLILHSGANGLFGLFTDYPVNIDLDEIEKCLQTLHAERSLRFLGSLKKTLPGKRFPRTRRQAAAVERLITIATEGESKRTKTLRECIARYSEETSDLPLELVQYLRRNRRELLDGLSS